MVVNLFCFGRSQGSSIADGSDSILSVAVTGNQKSGLDRTTEITDDTRGMSRFFAMIFLHTQKYLFSGSDNRRDTQSIDRCRIESDDTLDRLDTIKRRLSH